MGALRVLLGSGTTLDHEGRPAREGTHVSTSTRADAAVRDTATLPEAATPVGVKRRRRHLVLADLAGTVGIAGLVAVSALWLHNGGIQGLADRGGVATELGRLTGLLSAYLLLVQVLLMARIPWLEQTWGQDVLARRHRWVGFASFHLMLAHIVLITLGYAAAADSGIWRQAWELITDYPGMLLATAGTVALIMVVVTSVRAARRRMRYESWHLLHLYAYVGVGLAIPHQLWTGADFTSSQTATVLWWAMWIAAAGSIVWWRVAMPLARSWRHRLVVESVVRERPDVVSIVIAGRHLDRLGVRAGQFMQWRFLTRHGATRAHPFTLSAAPSPTRLRITAKELGDGTRALGAIPPGSRVLVEGPHGIMLAERREHRDVLLLAAGVGLTTMRGLAEEIAAEPAAPGPRGTRPPSVVVLHRVHSRSDALFVDEFTTLARRTDVQLRLLPGARAPQSGWWGGVVPVDPGTALATAVPDVADREIYLCGPPDWMRAVKNTLRELHIDQRHIHVEEFTW